ncbi:prefoldin subunit 2 [Cryptococcus gattii E566]|uniref:Prefoldin subunit 2, putative n=4 Tax=Cryptococcus gattii species complex TaxID=1884637 RepID=E6QXW4_CRYGW|nr:Prefoldin subunit 2, putative [Cryptococcus gattii WM276]KIR69248.1 prefoldin subunit 2 [Cryptococcus bacillisporus CA1873]KIR79707.1 prefoldin subunit 2 [Cryptococcus gattii EJB2]KIY37084.1 prefoldin subunit 2 [Cryptococcus gattii E566]KJE02804.1 prefoldin subunit 2 [Cryptococcus gattii NT-10]ADV19686.1 Prefoldin subunit 2, putative [Cryptococcus gattii WM276]|eukprot:KIR69248.1 prefoldin subunit 2 [Cryptococcus gattii CA1873]
MPPKAPTNAQEASIIFQRYRTELQNLAQKIGELESEMDEYSLVLSTLRPLKSSEPSRTCYRLIGGTLVKRSVQDVVPTLETTHSGIKEVLDSLVQSYQEKEKEFESWRKEAGIQMPR